MISLILKCKVDRIRQWLGLDNPAKIKEIQKNGGIDPEDALNVAKRFEALEKKRTGGIIESEDHLDIT
jgi:hypothetical protein